MADLDRATHEAVALGRAELAAARQLLSFAPQCDRAGGCFQPGEAKVFCRGCRFVFVLCAEDADRLSAARVLECRCGLISKPGEGFLISPLWSAS